MLKLKKNNAGSNGKISADYVVFSSSSDTSTHSSQTLSMANYSSSASGFVADWNIFSASRTPTPYIDENHVSITGAGEMVFFIASDTSKGIKGFKVP